MRDADPVLARSDAPKVLDIGSKEYGFVQAFYYA
jgi:hypothetical protein